MCLLIKIGARGSALSRVQVEEVLSELRAFYPEVEFDTQWVITHGDVDLKTSLRALEKTDFFTQEIDALQLKGECRISIHSAKDLPDPLPQGLTIAAITKGVDPSDVLVLRNEETLIMLPQAAKVGTSSVRREQNVILLRSDLQCVDIRGTITERLRQLDEGIFDAVVMAKAALIRLNLVHRTQIPLNGEKAEMQGQLAVVALENDEEMHSLFSCIDVRKT